MSPCPNLFDLNYQHAAFPFTWELAALTVAVLLFFCLHAAFNANAPWGFDKASLPAPSGRWSQSKPLHCPLTSKKGRSKAGWQGCNQTGRPTGIRQPAAISLLLTFFTPLIPSISFSFFLPESPLISLLLPISVAARADDVSVWWRAVMLSLEDCKIFGFSRGTEWTASNDSVYNPRLALRCFHPVM